MEGIEPPNALLESAGIPLTYTPNLLIVPHFHFLYSVPMPHTPPPHHLELEQALHAERHQMSQVYIPITTVSATFRKELADKYHLTIHPHADVVFSRAHYSMAQALVQQAALDGHTAHLVDPTNFVSESDWSKIEFTETVGQAIARNSLLKWLKDKVDLVARNKLPLSQAIKSPLLYITAKTIRPIISLHYETGRLLAHAGKTVLQVITDPHVRPQYVQFANHANASYAVFDAPTRQTFFKLAQDLGLQVPSNRVTVTGPPIDPRIARIRSHPKKIVKHQPINLGITTGGLGTNLNEIKQVLQEFAPLLASPEKIRLFLHAGSHRDFRNFFEDFALANSIRIGNLDDTQARIRILYEDSIIDANENLIKYMFPWAHGLITKPSGDMAYDAAAAGCFLLFLEPWGEWEVNVQNIFLGNGVAHDLDISQPKQQFTSLLSRQLLAKSLTSAHNLPPLFRTGASNILAAAQNLA